MRLKMGMWSIFDSVFKHSRLLFSPDPPPGWSGCKGPVHPGGGFPEVSSRESYLRFFPLRLIVVLMTISFVPLCPIPAYALKCDEDSAAEIFAKQSDAIVLIAALNKNKKNSRLGSGFIVSEDGQIITNYHIVKKAKKIFVKLKNNRVYNHVRLISFDSGKDIAVLKIDARHLKKVQLGNSSEVKIGQRVITIGNPLGLESSIADGLISSLREDERGHTILQISVPLSSGSSGGPLFNLDGEVVGITTASLLNGQNLNFAVPINYARSLLKGEVDTPKTKDAPRRNLARRVTLKDKRQLHYEQSEHFEFYQVQPSDTLYGLSKKFDTTVTRLMSLNELLDTKISAGQRIKIPRQESLNSER